MNRDPGAHGLEPALELSSYVAAVKLARAGRQRRLRPALRRRARDLDRDAADRLRATGSAARSRTTATCSIGGRRYPLVGTVSMDNITVELGRRERRGGRASAATIIGARRRASARPPRSWRGGSGRSTTRSCAGSRRGCRGSTTATGSRVSELTADPLEALGAARGARRGSSAARSATGCSGAPTADYDVAVAGDAGERRAALARAAGGHAVRAVGGVRRPGAWSRATAAGRSTCCRSLARSIEADLGAARPHVNAIAAAAARGRARRSVRGVARPRRAHGCGWSPPEAFSRDPLRALRLARLACELDFSVEPETARRAARKRARRWTRSRPSGCSPSSSGS